MSLGFSVDLICAFKCVFAVDTRSRHSGEVPNVLPCKRQAENIVIKL